MDLKNQDLLKYYQTGFNEVYGWCDAELFQTVDLLASQPINQTGGACEIGIQHGKLFLLLNQVIDRQYNSYAIDVFNNQHLNIDKSGEGNLEVFRNNLARFDKFQGQNTVIIPGDSTDTRLKLSEHIEPGSLRFFSIDGGHTAIHTVNDLKIANELISNEGVVILDDIMNHWWTGVLEGWINYSKSTPTLVPFAMGHNKLYLSKISYRDYYFDLMNTLNLDGPKTASDFFGHKIIKWKYWSVMPW